MNFFEFLVGFRFTLTGKHDRFVSFVSALSMLGIALGIAALLTVLAVMTGFQNQLRERILGVASHLEVAHHSNTISQWQDTAAPFLEHPQVLAAAPNIQQQGLLVHGSQAQGALIRGILPEYEKDVNAVTDYLEQGDINALTANSYNVFLGAGLARRLGVRIGDNVMLVAPKGRLLATGFVPRLRRLKVAGIFRAGVHQYDSSLAYMHLQDAQRIYQLGDTITSLRFRLDDVINAPQVRNELQKNHSSDYVIYDWTNSHGNLFRALALEKRAMFVILTLIVMVAAFNIASALVTMVRNKRGEIAILRAMGASGSNITRIFLLQGMFIGGGGVLLGLLLGLPLAFHVGALVSWLETKLGYSLFPGNVYQLGNLPSQVVLSDVLIVAITAFCIALAAAAIPAWRSGKLQPAESLRHE